MPKTFVAKTLLPAVWQRFYCSIPVFTPLFFIGLAIGCISTSGFFLARMVSQWGRGFTGIEIHPGASIGKGLFIDHGLGVVIGETAEIGDNCTIYHQVTLGGTGKEHGKRHPTLGSNVLVGAGAKVLGPVEIGDNTRIAAGSVVLQSLPCNCTAAGIPAIVVRRDGAKICPSDDLNQQNIPDVVHSQLCELERRMGILECRAKNAQPQSKP